MRRLRLAFRLVVRRHRLTTIAQDEIPEHSSKELKTSLRLVKRYFMAGFVDSHEAEIAVLSYFAIFGTINYELLVASLSEFFGVGVVDFQAYCFAAEPVAYT